MRLLLDRGADVNERDGISGTALHMAAANANVDAVKLLIDRGADVNARTTAGTTPLEAASTRKTKKAKKVQEMLKDAGGEMDDTMCSDMNTRNMIGAMQEALESGEDPCKQS